MVWFRLASLVSSARTGPARCGCRGDEDVHGRSGSTWRPAVRDAILSNLKDIPAATIDVIAAGFDATTRLFIPLTSNKGNLIRIYDPMTGGPTSWEFYGG